MAVASAVPRAAIHRRVAQVPRRGVLAGLIGSELVVLFVLLRNDGWVRDDNLMMVFKARAGFGWHWLTTVFFQHWGISYNVVVAAVYKLFPLDHRWALVGMLVLLGGSIWLMEGIIRLLFGRPWLALAVAGCFGLSVLFIRPLQWWAGGLQYLPNTFFDLLCLYAYVRFQREHAGRWILVGAGALAAGLSFYEKPGFMVGYLLLIRVLLLSRDLRPRDIASALWGERAFWAALLAVIVVWVSAYLAVGAGRGYVSLPLGPKYLTYFRVLWVNGLVPAVFGVTVPGSGLSAAQTVLVVALQAAVVLTVLVSLYRDPGAWRPWVFIGIIVVVTGLLVARTRLAPFPATYLGTDLRYLLDFAWLVPLAVCFAFFGRHDLPPADADAGAPRAIAVRLRPGVFVGAAALATYVVISILTIAKLERQWPGREGRAYESRLQSGIARLQTRTTHPVIADGTVPWYMVDTRFVPANRLSAIAPLYVPGAQVDGVLDGPLAVVDQDGSVHRAIVATIGTGNPTVLLRTHRLTITSGQSRAETAGGRCFIAGAGSMSVSRTPEMSPADSDQPYYLTLSYSAARRREKLPVYIDPGSGPWYGPAWLSIAPGRHTSILLLPVRRPRHVLLRIGPSDSICITDFGIAALHAAG